MISGAVCFDSHHYINTAWMGINSVWAYTCGFLSALPINMEY